MRARSKAVGTALAVAGAVALARVVAPARFAAGREGFRQAVEGLPRPVALGGLVVVVLVGWLAGMWLVAHASYRLWRGVSPRVRWIVGIVLPESPLVKFATGVMALLTVTMVIIGAVPAFLDGAANTSDGGVSGYAEQLSERGLTSDWGAVVQGDTASGTAACRERTVEGPDSDADGLPDRWERAGETPGGAALPDADPYHKDLYVQINYGSTIAPLSGAEREQLRRIWATMPVENPDGETGIDLHVVDSGTRSGDIGEKAVFESPDTYDRYYTEQRLGPRHCVYHQVVYGRLRLGNVVGYGATPGYATIVEGRQPDDYETRYAPRIGVTTHELLHNVAGHVNGKAHTSTGWLNGGSNDAYLSAATASDLNRTGLFGPVT